MKSTITLMMMLISTLIFAQQSSISGKVIDVQGAPIVYADVVIKGSTIGVSTDENGQFELTKINAGEVVLQISFLGYKTIEENISLLANPFQNKTFVLEINPEMLDEVVIKGNLGQNLSVAKLGKAGIKSMDLPQAVFSLDEKILTDQQVRSMQDVLMNTNGVYIMGATGGYQEEIAGRGFSFRSDNTLKNGVRYFNGMMSELSGIEKVEVLKGSAAILYGNVSAGGVLNLITKKPRFDRGGEISMTTGSFGLTKPGFDIYGPINKSKTLAFRWNGSYTKQNSFRQDVFSESFYLNPSLLFKVNSNTELLVEADYTQDTRVPDFGAGIVNYEVIPNFPRDRFLGVRWGRYNAKQLSASASLNHKFSKILNGDIMVAYRNYDTHLFTNARPNSGGLIKEDGNWSRSIQRSNSANDYLLAQANLRADFNTAGIQHRALFGFDTDYSRSTTLAYDQFRNYDVVNIFEDQPADAGTIIPEMTLNRTTVNPVNRYGVFLQDLLSFNEQWKVLAGLRYSVQESVSDITTAATGETEFGAKSSDGAFSPRLGIVYQPAKRHSMFLSYSNSFELNTGVDVSGNALPPSTYDQYEIGVKNDMYNGNLSVNVTAYLIDVDNLAQQSLANGNTDRNIKELAGGIRSKGVELDLMATPIKGMRVVAGYSYNQAQYTSSNIYIVGDYLRYNPRHTANASVHYNLTPAFKAGFTAAYIGERFAGRNALAAGSSDNRRNIPVDAYTQLDFSASYQLGAFIIRGKIGNLTNAYSFNVHDDNSVNPITPRNFSASLSYKF